MKLKLGYNTSFEVRKEYYTWDCKLPFSILYLSDFHFNGYSKDIAAAMTAKIKELDPDILLLGGDHVDTPKGLVHFENFMNSISARKNIFSIAGNHDYFFGVNKIKEIILRNNGRWIEKDSFSLELKGMDIKIDGNEIFQKNNSGFNILCLHKPINLKNFSDHYNLAFAGHLHGSQFVLWENEKGMYPGRFFYKWNRLKATMNSCLYLVSKGLGDTLAIRFNCPKDIIFVSVSSNR